MLITSGLGDTPQVSYHIYKYSSMVEQTIVSGENYWLTEGTGKILTYPDQYSNSGSAELQSAVFGNTLI